MMIGIICSSVDIASMNMFEFISNEYDFEENGGEKPYRRFTNEEVDLYLTDLPLIEADFVDDLCMDRAYFLSKHKSSSGKVSFTTHSTGNWGKGALFGGKPRKLSVAAPSYMRSILQSLFSLGLDRGVERTYEATHHGPLLRTPSLFIEFGGPESVIEDKGFAKALGKLAYSKIINDIDSIPDASKVVFGIGGSHYPERFTKLALEKDYAFSHIMPKHATADEDGEENLIMLEEAAAKSGEELDSCVIDWKGLNSEMRGKVIKCLEEMGLDYEKA